MSASYLSVLNKLQSTEHARTYVCTCRIPEHVKQQNATSLAQRKSSQCVAVDSSKPGERSQGVSIDMAPARRGIAEKREKHRSNWHTGSVWCKPCRFGRTFFGTPVVRAMNFQQKIFTGTELLHTLHPHIRDRLEKIQ